MHSRRWPRGVTLTAVLGLLGVALLAACASRPVTAPTPTLPVTPVPVSATSSPTPAVTRPPTPVPSSTPAATPTPMPTPTGAPVLPLPALDRPKEVRLQIADGTEAAYMVREQLATLKSPNDAVGVTKAVTGSIEFGPNNAIQADRSKITVDLRTLKSDEGRRDRYIQRSTLETHRFPYVEFAPKEVGGLAWPLPTAGEARFTLAGDLALHGVSRPITWEVTAQFSPNEILGQATTNFRFAEFGITAPRVFFVLSVEDNIRLRLDFQLARAGE